ncbi:hypothetical protein M501DRAFT_1027341 [Patellaria atrata CBS 101060]|uniref:Cyclase n=1 Tax=Patellaria atrata CBS 101060 TaxID=1346257 RepID=A0A9P4S0Y2_9PEZI|nr:hypothetical protein M501DRAFT_1027341 [Patellaria atrata CBS 101060]
MSSLHPQPTAPIRPYPKFSELPLNPSDPAYSAWGLYGPKDELGTLNQLTRERTVAAAREIKSGIRIGLNWGLENMDIDSFRQTLKHEIFSIGHMMFDDRVDINTQNSSQWDGLRHWGYDDGRFYGGLTDKDILKSGSTKLGIQAWQGGIVGRGVLVDFLGWVEEQKSNGLDYDPLSHHAVPLKTIKEILKQKNVTIRSGDILFLRMGFTGGFAAADIERKKAVLSQSPFQYPGIESTLAVAEWLWDERIAAVAGDCPGFEAWPPTEHELHRTLLAGFGMPIGELFDLDSLADQCKKEGRWSFFVCSEPLNVRGGIASPPNAVAIF